MNNPRIYFLSKETMVLFVNWLALCSQKDVKPFSVATKHTLVVLRSNACSKTFHLFYYPILLLAFLAIFAFIIIIIIISHEFTILPFSFGALKLLYQLKLICSNGKLISKNHVDCL